MERCRNVLIFALLLGWACLLPAHALGEEEKAQEGSSSPQETSGFNVGAFMVSFFQEHLSAVDSDRCPSYPTCSSYSVQAFRKHGFVLGWLMTVDRLIHEGSEETAVSPLIYIEGKWKIYDPIQNNDFWWYRPPETRTHE